MTKKMVFLTTTMAILISVTGCGKDESSGPDFSGMAASIDSPTGSVASAETAQGVSEAFAEQLSSSNMMPTGESATMDCEVSGSVSASGNESAATFSYNSCCEMEDCCFDGDGSMSMDVDGFMMCMSFDVDVDCEGVSGPLDMNFCSSDDGEMWFVVEFEGDTYACSGSFDSSYGGTWTIRDSSSEWNCEATCTDGDCTGSCTDGSDTYEW